MPVPDGTYTSACPRNCYSTCGLQVTVADGKLRRLEAHPGNAATANGICLKGLSYIERVSSPDRLLFPQARIAGTDRFRRVSWDEALDAIAEQVSRARREFGPQSVLYYSSSGTKGLLNCAGDRFWRLFGGYTTTYGDLCWPAGLEATRLTLGANEHNAPWDLANAQLIVFWGKNAAETNIHQMAFVEQALARGARVVVIDPRRTETTERATLHLQPRPGTDAAIALAVAHVLFARDWTDRGFIEAHVQGADRFRESVHTCTPEWAAEVAGVDPRAIERLAELVGTVAPMTICAGFGMQRYTNSGQTMRALLALVVLTGNIGKPGAGWIFANLRTQVFGGEKDPIAFYPPAASDGVVRVSISTAMLGPHMLATHDPPLKVAWLERGNPIPQNPETATVMRAFRALDFRVVVDEVMTDTAREADIVLPAKTFFEQTDVIGAYWHDYLQLRPKLIDPPGDVKPETEIYRLLAARLGIPQADVDAAIPADDRIEAWLTERLAAMPGVTLDALRRGPVRVPGTGDIAFADLCFPTPSGRIELWSDEAVARWDADPLPSYREPVEGSRGSLAEKYPLSLLTPNTKTRIHSQFGHLSAMRAIEPRPVLAMHPVDAAARGIGAGDQVRVFNERGALSVACRLDAGLRAGCVTLHNGWWVRDGGAVNLLSQARETDMGHGAAFHENQVQVERA